MIYGGIAILGRVAHLEAGFLGNLLAIFLDRDAWCPRLTLLKRVHHQGL